MQLIDTLLFIAECSYVLVGIDLLRRAKVTRGLPEFFLGIAFVFNGLSYFFTDLPIVTGNDAILNEFSFVGRILAGGCALTIGVFTWRTFHQESLLAKGFLWAVSMLIVVGLSVSALEGDWEGAYPLTYKGFWFEWVGGMLPFVWLATESIRAYAQTRKRVRIGLSDPLVANRFLLIGLYGVLASLTYPIFLWMYIEYERHGVWSDPLSIGVGVVELVSLAALWTTVAAPEFYRRRISSAEPSA